jgi:hypothetical protein
MAIQYVSFQPHLGTILHYYHFFFACLIPLIDFKLQHPNITEFRLTESIGPFHRMVSRDIYLNVRVVGNTSLTGTENILQLPAYDTFENRFFTNASYDKMPISVRDNLIKFFETTLPGPVKKHRNMWAAVHEPRIVFIQRKADPEFNSGTFASSSGAYRRYIQNHREIKSALKLKYRRSTVNIAMENMNIYDQYVTFRSANILIAQHGAALANMIFMNSLGEVIGTTSGELRNSFAHVIEISPPYGRASKYFRNMAAHFNVSYSSIEQNETKGDVDVNVVLAHLECVLGNISLPSSHGVFAIGEACGDIVGTYVPPPSSPPHADPSPELQLARVHNRRPARNTTRRRRRPLNRTEVRLRKPPVGNRERRRAPPVRRPQPKATLTPAPPRAVVREEGEEMKLVDLESALSAKANKEARQG